MREARRRYAPRPETGRRVAIARVMRADGRTLREIGAALGMKWSAVAQLCERYHLPRPQTKQPWDKWIKRRLPAFPGVLSLAKTRSRQAECRRYWQGAA